jgi:HSP20 family protein
MISGFRDPFEALFALQRALDSRLSSDWMGGRTTSVGTYPPINVFQRGDGVVAIIELPGIDKNEIEIEAKENTIRIFGRKSISYDQAASVHRRERVSGVFDRTLSVPFKSIQMPLRQSTAMACWPSLFRPRKVKSRGP